MIFIEYLQFKNITPRLRNDIHTLIGTVLIILAASVLVTIPYEISTGPLTNVAKAAITPLISKNIKVAVDKFGITEIYPTKTNGGREWYINATSPLTDKSFFLSGGTEKANSSLANATSSNGQIRKQTDVLR